MCSDKNSTYYVDVGVTWRYEKKSLVHTSLKMNIPSSARPLFFTTLTSILSLFTLCLSDSVSSVLLSNYIIKPFSYSCHTVSNPPPPLLTNPHSFKSMRLHRPFLSLWLWILFSLPSSEYFTLLLCLPRFLSPSVTTSSPISPSVCLSVCLSRRF